MSCSQLFCWRTENDLRCYLIFAPHHAEAYERLQRDCKSICVVHFLCRKECWISGTCNVLLFWEKYVSLAVKYYRVFFYFIYLNFMSYMYLIKYILYSLKISPNYSIFLVHLNVQIFTKLKPLSGIFLITTVHRYWCWMSSCVPSFCANKVIITTTDKWTFDSHMLFLRQPQWYVSASVQRWGASGVSQHVSYLPDEILQRKREWYKEK